MARLECHTDLEIRLVDLFPNITSGDGYGMQIHGYMRLSHTEDTITIVHSHGQALLHLGHCLFQVSNAGTTPDPVLAKGTHDVIPSLREQQLFHFQLTFT